MNRTTLNPSALKSFHRCENMGQLVMSWSMQVRLQLPQGKILPPWLGCAYLLAMENITALLLGKIAYLSSLLFLRYSLGSFSRNNLEENNNVPV